MTRVNKKIRRLDEAAVRALLPPRPIDGHKGTFGHLLSVCGCRGMAGAARFAAEAAYRCGTGLVTAAMPETLYPIVTAGVPEAVCRLLPEEETGGVAATAVDTLRGSLEKATAVLCGCGLGQGDGAAAVLLWLMKTADCPLVIDADGLNLLSVHKDRVESKPALCLTPHPAEAARLLSSTVEEIEKNRPAAAEALAKLYGAVVVLKGHETVIAAPTKPTLQNSTGDDTLAKGGSGDVLAGMIAGLAAQGMSLYDAAACGVYLHGLAGERAGRRLSRRGALARDVLTELARLLSEFE